jgi:hypothetical protein
VVQKALSFPLVLLCMVGSCLDYDVLDPPRQITHVTGTLHFEQTDSSQIRGELIIDPGTNAAGTRNEMQDTTLQIESVLIQPVETVRGIRVYRPVLPLPASAVEQLALNLTFPAIPAADAAQLMVAVPILVRTSDAPIILRRGNDLVLTTRSSPQFGAERGWHLDLGSSCGGQDRIASFQVSGAPPDTIVIPWTGILNAAQNNFTACLTYNWVVTRESGSYPITLFAHAFLSWKVAIVE